MSSSTPAVHRLDKTISIRVSSGERELISFLASRADVSVGRYVVLACRAFGRGQLDDWQGRIQAVIRRAEHDCARFSKRKVKRHRETYERMATASLKVPFLRREYARPFERVVAYVAEHMHASPHSIARALSFFAEAVGDEVANGQVVRFPGFFVVGPWRTERGTPEVVPRLQASPPFKSHVLFNCPLGDAQNRALRAHRRRRRMRTSLLPKAMEAFRARIEAQDRSILDGLEGWREFNP